MSDTLLLKSAVDLLVEFHRNAALRVAANTGTARLLSWQSEELQAAAWLQLAQAEHLVNRSRELRQAAQALRNSEGRSRLASIKIAQSLMVEAPVAESA